VRDGRRAEFKRWPQFADPANRLKIPDPNALATAEASRIDWNFKNTPAGAARIALVRNLLAIRKRLVPHFAAMRSGQGNAGIWSAEAFGVAWRMADGQTLRMAVNLGEAPVATSTHADLTLLYESSDGACASLRLGQVPPKSVILGFEGGAENG
jgi:hypothetical protein